MDFTAAADYKCTVVYLHSLGTLESEAFPVFVQGNFFYFHFHFHFLISVILSSYEVQMVVYAFSSRLIVDENLNCQNLINK